MVQVGVGVRDLLGEAAADSRPRSARAGARTRPFRALTVGFSIVCAIVAASSLSPRRTLPRKVGVETNSLRASRAPRSACEVVQPRVEHRRSDSASAAISFSRSRSPASTWCARSSSEIERVVALALERAPQPASRSSTRCAAASLTWFDPLGEHALGLAGEPLDREVELAGEPAGGLLARGADRRRRTAAPPPRRSACVSRETIRCSCSTCRRSTSPSCELDALGRLVPARARSDLLQLALALAQPLGDLVQRAPALGRVLLELGARRLRRPPARERVEVRRAAWRCSCALLLELRLRAASASWPIFASIVGDQLLLRWPRSARSSSVEALLELRRRRRPSRAKRCSTAALRVGERVAELRGRVALALGDVAAALLGDPPLLVGEQRERLGARERERPLELLGALLGLLRDDRVERAPCRARSPGRAARSTPRIRRSASDAACERAHGQRRRRRRRRWRRRSRFIG